MARAFDAVHGQAVRLAAEQAALQSNVSAMFVNLSRRSQALVERQLQLIEQLESNEQDPDQLSNLFQLDHLATRMRRNSENLLVLAGTDLAKRNIAPVPMVDVLRAAVSEIEQYQRIVVQTPPTATVAGPLGVRPRPPAGRAARQRHELLPARLAGGHEHRPHRRRVDRRGDRRPRRRHGRPRAQRRQPAALRARRRSTSRRPGAWACSWSVASPPATASASGSSRPPPVVRVPASPRSSPCRRTSSRPSSPPSCGRSACPQPPGSRPRAAVPALSRSAAPALNGTARHGGLSALVAGTDGPANPAGVFDAPARQDGQLFTPAAAEQRGEREPAAHQAAGLHDPAGRPAAAAHAARAAGALGPGTRPGRGRARRRGAGQGDRPAGPPRPGGRSRESRGRTGRGRAAGQRTTAASLARHPEGSHRNGAAVRAAPRRLSPRPARHPRTAPARSPAPTSGRPGRCGAAGAGGGRARPSPARRSPPGCRSAPARAAARSPRRRCRCR